MPELCDQDYHHKPRKGLDGLQLQKFDPKVERVWRKLLYLLVISIVITLFLIGTVLVVIIHKVTRRVVLHPADISFPTHMKVIDQDRAIILSSGAHFVSQSLSGHLISLDILQPDGSTEIIIYDYSTGKIVTRLKMLTGDDETSVVQAKESQEIHEK